MTAKLILLPLSLALLGCKGGNNEEKSPASAQTTAPKPVEQAMPAMTPAATPAATPTPMPVAAQKPMAKGSNSRHERRLHAVAKPWDIGSVLKDLTPADLAKAKALGPEVRAPARPTKGAPAPYRTTAFVTIHPAHLISGNTDLMMPRALTESMDAAEEQEVYYRGRVCVNPKGVPLFVQTIESTSVPAADQEVKKAVMGWRYEPYAPNGKPTAFCTGVNFLFHLQDPGAPNPQ